jgi:hypothetical protein
MNYIQLAQAIQDYSENTEALFVANIPTFVQEAEKRIYNSVQLPTLRKNMVGNLTPSNPYLTLPTDWLATYSIAVIDSSGNYTYLLNKDVNFMREAYPTATTTGKPKYYAIFGPNVANTQAMTCLLAPTPDQNYNTELHFFYYPITIVQGQINQLSITNAGSGYTTGTFYNVPITGGSGANATATVVVNSVGVVSSISVTSPGSLYAIGNSVSISTSSVGNGTLFSATVVLVTNSTGTSWLGDNYDPVLFYGAMREAVIFMKGEADMVTYYEKMFQEAIAEVKRLGDGLERNDAYRKGQTSLEYKGL